MNEFLTWLMTCRSEAENTKQFDLANKFNQVLNTMVMNRVVTAEEFESIVQQWAVKRTIDKVQNLTEWVEFWDLILVKASQHLPDKERFHEVMRKVIVNYDETLRDLVDR